MPTAIRRPAPSSRKPLRNCALTSHLSSQGLLDEDTIPGCVDRLYHEVIGELVETCDMIDVEYVVDSKHSMVLEALRRCDQLVRDKMMPPAAPAHQICSHLDVCTMGVLKDKRESAGLCAVSFDSPFDRIFAEESTIAISDIGEGVRECGESSSQPRPQPRLARPWI